MLGMVLDKDISRIRPVYGVPGAAVLGDALDTGNDIHAATVAASGQYALVLSGTDTHAALLYADGPLETPVAVVQAGVSQSALSPDGTAAAFYYAQDQTVQVVSGLPAAAVAVRSFDVSALPGGTVLAAVSDDGQWVLYSGDTYEVFVLGGESGLRRVALNGVPTALAFRSGSHDAMVATAQGVEWIEQTARGLALRPVALPGNAVTGNRGNISYIGISRDGSQGFFMESTGRVSLAGLDATRSAGVAAQSLGCNCAGATPQFAAGGTSYILSEYQKGNPISLLDAASSPTRVLLIPPSSPDGRLP